MERMLAEYNMNITMVASAESKDELLKVEEKFSTLTKGDSFLSDLNAAIKTACEKANVAVVESTGLITVFGSNLVFYVATLFVSLITILWL